MIDTRWQQLEALFLEAGDLAPATRDTYLRQACGDDADLRRNVDALLDAENAADAAISSTVSSAAQDFVERAALSRIGERIGAYRLVDIIGQGGMGTVYLAERADDAYRSRVAIKFVRSSLAAPDLVRRFLAERQILADLNHPGIARLLDGGTTIDGTPYLVLEFVDGEPVDSYCESSGLNVRERVALLIKVCAAVQAAHEANVVHRDLKPSNILVTSDGAPKLVDFGIAKLVADPVEPNTASALQMLTPAYASPEQVRGQKVTVASDVYSLGVVMYQVLTGHLPFDLSRASAGEVERRVSREVPPLLSRAARDRAAAWKQELHGELEAIAARVLEKRVELRPPSAAALAADLQSWYLKPSRRGRGRAWVFRARRHRLEIAAALALAIVGVTTAVRALATRRDEVIAFQVLPAQVVEHGLPSPVRVLSADVNGDGFRDLVWNHLDDSTNQFALGLGQADGSFLLRPVVSHPSRPDEGWHRSVQLLVGDVNGDGRDDLVWCRVGEALGNLVFVAFANSDATFRFAEPFRFGHATLRWGTGWEVLTGDLDGDGSDDLVFNHLDNANQVRAFTSRRDGTFDTLDPVVHFAQRWQGYRTFLADVNGDDRQDIVWNDVPVWANRTYVATSWGNRFDLLSQQDHGVADGWSEAAASVADLDGDGKSDIIWTKTLADSLHVFVALGQSNAQFQFLPVRRLALNDQLRLTSPVTGDFNGDGRADFAWRSQGASDLVVLRASRGGRLSLERIAGFPVIGSPEGNLLPDLLAMDVNADGRDDLVWHDRATGRLYVGVAAPRS